MAVTNIKRLTQVHTSVIANDQAEGSAIKIEGHQAGVVIMPVAWTAASLGFKVCDTENGTYVILRGVDGVPVQITGIVTDGSNAYKIPEGVFEGPIWIKPWSKHATAGTITNITQGAARTLKIIVS